MIVIDVALPDTPTAPLVLVAARSIGVDSPVLAALVGLVVGTGLLGILYWTFCMSREVRSNLIGRIRQIRSV